MSLIINKASGNAKRTRSAVFKEIHMYEIPDQNEYHISTSHILKIMFKNRKLIG
jgi:hypothetical protein